jgi:lactoylglutathione lyase
MSRVQLALNVDDIDVAVAFYSQLFQVEPAKRRPGYANFAVDEPALKLVLIENPGHGGSLNHLGVEVASTDEVAAATKRLAAEGLAVDVQEGTTCCYAVQDKVWATGPGGERWEVYTVLADAGAELEGKSLAEVGSMPAVATSATATETSVVPANSDGCCAS